MATIPTPEPAECTCLVTAEHRILDRDCPQHGTAADAARRHRPWCDESECITRPDGQIVHRSEGAVFDFSTTQIWTASMLTVQLVETAEGIEVGVSVLGAISTYSATLDPQVAAELGDALLDHAERALGLMAGPRGTYPPEADLPAVLLEALEDVSISDEERGALLEVGALGEDVTRHVAALITRARRNSSADR